MDEKIDTEEPVDTATTNESNASSDIGSDNINDKNTSTMNVRGIKC